ncbi:hypothetical protein ACFSHQ_21705 [Gemmobacter lanyuensis]
MRSGDCRVNLLHTLPEDSARTDALMQVLVAKRWTRLALITGPKSADAAYAEALRASARKFGLEIVGEKAWTFDTDLRRAATTELPPSPRICLTMTCCWWPMKPMISAAMSNTTPGCPAPSPGPRGWSLWAGPRCWNNGGGAAAKPLQGRRRAPHAKPRLCRLGRHPRNR